MGLALGLGLESDLGLESYLESVLELDSESYVAEISSKPEKLGAKSSVEYPPICSDSQLLPSLDAITLYIHSASGSGYRFGRRNSRFGNGKNSGGSIADGAPGIQYIAHQRRAFVHCTFTRFGPGAIFDFGDAGRHRSATAGT